jgi:hypothetical protein
MSLEVTVFKLDFTELFDWPDIFKLFELFDWIELINWFDWLTEEMEPTERELLFDIPETANSQLRVWALYWVNKGHCAHWS